MSVSWQTDNTIQSPNERGGGGRPVETPREESPGYHDDAEMFVS